jgi:hypothetical protein
MTQNTPTTHVCLYKIHSTFDKVFFTLVSRLVTWSACIVKLVTMLQIKWLANLRPPH